MFRHLKKANAGQGVDADKPAKASAPRIGEAQPAVWLRALGRLPMQAKLTVNQPGDMYEKEADRVAAQVMRMPDPATAGSAGGVRRCACGGVVDETGECPACRAKRLGLQRKGDAAGGMQAPASVHETIGAPGQPLDAGTRGFMEARFGHDFGGVRVHTDGKAAESTRAVGAHAYTVGQSIAFAEGRYAPGTNSGNLLLAHELAHVVQQGQAEAAPVLQRQCDKNEEHFRSAPNFCLDTSFSPSTHPGKNCYREIVPRSGWLDCPPGSHVCFDSQGQCENSPDKASLAGDKKADGSCSWRWWCVGQHTLADFVPSVLQLDCMQACKNVPDPRCMIQCVGSKH
jgi:hypothetical protein